MEQARKKSPEVSSASAPPLHFMDRLRSWQGSAKDAVSAVRHDYREVSRGVKQVAREFQEKSEVMAYFRERTEGPTARQKKPMDRPGANAQAGRSQQGSQQSTQTMSSGGQ